MFIVRSIQFINRNVGFGAHVRHMSSFKLVNLEINKESGIAIAEMNRPPVNSLNLELLNDLVHAIEMAENNKCLGMVLTSSSNSVFSAGLDIMEMYDPKPDRLKMFWTTLQVRLASIKCP